jgi:hypothetical protein
LSPVKKRLDLQALAQDLDTVIPITSLESIVEFFAND